VFRKRLTGFADENLIDDSPQRRRSHKTYCTKLKCVGKLMIINEIFVEATGVELITMLRTRKLLILGTATRAKKAPLPDPLYVYCTKMPSLWSPAETTQ
jgi:hypothetical protein